MSGAAPAPGFVSRAGNKLHWALEAFGLKVEGYVCADFGCNVGGFTDCLLQHGSRLVYALDTGYGELAWKLRKDPRVVVLERTNALYHEAPEPVDLVVIDVAWTPQSLIVPAAMRWLRPGGGIVSLLKPHYELQKVSRRTVRAPLGLHESHQVCLGVCRELTAASYEVKALTVSPIEGKGGNAEYLLWIGGPK
jgi:23S rRNA (cytidine1920-2'-O)/16S rRNA (cytidine1409-2'-O)-methyltransferase